MPPFTVKDLAREVGAGIIEPARLQEFDADVVREVKLGLRSGFRGISNAIVREADAKKATATYAATVEVIDRMGDLVLTRPRKALSRPMEDGTRKIGEGFLTENHQAAGAPFLWSHLSRDHAVGQVTTSKQQKIDTPRDGRVWATVQGVKYLVDERIPHAVPTWLLVEAGIARSVSVGFSSLLAYWPEDDVREKLGMPRYGVIFLTSDQTELSQAQTPACQLALARSADADQGQIERDSLEVLERAVKEKRKVGGVQITEGLLADFRKEFPLGPTQERDVLQGRLDGFFDMGDVSMELERLFDDEETKAAQAEARVYQDAESDAAHDSEPAEEAKEASGDGSGDALPEFDASVERTHPGTGEVSTPVEVGPTIQDCIERGERGALQVSDIKTLIDHAKSHPPSVDKAIAIEVKGAEQFKASMGAPPPTGTARDSARGEILSVFEDATKVLRRLSAKAGIGDDVALEEVERVLGERLESKAIEPAPPAPMKLAPGDQMVLERAFESVSDGVEALADLCERALDTQRGLDSEDLPHQARSVEVVEAPPMQLIIRRMEQIATHLGIGGAGTDASPAADRHTGSALDVPLSDLF